jgi:hypothetical protein
LLIPRNDDCSNLQACAHGIVFPSFSTLRHIASEPDSGSIDTKVSCCRAATGGKLGGSCGVGAAAGLAQCRQSAPDSGLGDEVSWAAHAVLVLPLGWHNIGKHVGQLMGGCQQTVAVGRKRQSWRWVAERVNKVSGCCRSGIWGRRCWHFDFRSEPYQCFGVALGSGFPDPHRTTQICAVRLHGSLPVHPPLSLSLERGDTTLLHWIRSHS